MTFQFSLATETDLPEIMEIMAETKSLLSTPDWFVEDEAESVLSVIRGQGFAIAARTEEGTMAGFFIVRKPKPEENLGQYLSYSEAQLNKVLLMDSTAVRLPYRGYKLQKQMVLAAEAHITSEKPYYLLCTVHPDNQYSLSNMCACGYQIRASVRCYGGLPRLVLEKRIQ